MQAEQLTLFNTQAYPRQPFAWIGSKRRSAKQIIEYFPKDFNTYYEPFLGSGAMFCALTCRDMIKRAILSDTNLDIITVFELLKHKPRALWDAYQQKMAQNSKEFFLIERARRSEEMNELDRASRMLYVCSTAFFNTYKMKANGTVDAPWDKTKNGNGIFCTRENFLELSKALAKAQMFTCDYSEAMDLPQTGDVVYCDPPYQQRTVKHQYGHDKGYSLNGLLESAKACAKREATVLLSDSWHEDTQAQYEQAGFEVHKICADIAVNYFGKAKQADSLKSFDLLAVKVAGMRH